MTPRRADLRIVLGLLTTRLPIARQGSYISERVKFKDFLRIFKAMYQQIQGLNTEEKAF